MTDLVKRNEYPMTEWDPFRMMREVFRDPFFREMSPWGQRAFERESWTPTFEVRENGTTLRILADLPGIARDDLDVTLTGHRLVISGRREAEHHTNEEHVHTFERSFGQFTRAFSLPDYTDVEHITSDLRDGVLTIVVPKRGGQVRKVQIGGAASTKA